LKARIGQRRHFNDERVIVVVHNDVHARQSDHFVQAVSAFVHGTVSRHQDAHFVAIFLKQLGQFGH
jgi:Ni2+-binding GTPase involved in maturation of urease and hydrogenase